MRARTQASPGRSAPGFTLVELVVVIVLLGILAATAYPRFAGRGGYDELTARERVKLALRQAQTLAMTRTDAAVSFTSTPNTVSVAVGGTPVALPGGGSYPLDLGTLAITAANLAYTRLGGLVSGADATLTLTGGERSLSLCVDGATGYAYDC